MTAAWLSAGSDWVTVLEATVTPCAGAATTVLGWPETVFFVNVTVLVPVYRRSPARLPLIVLSWTSMSWLTPKAASPALRLPSALLSLKVEPLTSRSATPRLYRAFSATFATLRGGDGGA